MEQKTVEVNGKQRQAYMIRGRWYVRKGYDLPIEIAETWERKCDRLGDDETKIVEKFITLFVDVNGWGEETKQPPVFEPRAIFHIKDALSRLGRAVVPEWMLKEN